MTVLDSLESEKHKVSNNSKLRSEQEAIDIALKNHHALIDGNNSTVESRSATSLLRTHNPVEIISSTKSRAQQGDTLIYVVNFGEDNGFALVPANKNAEEILCLTEYGSFEEVSETVSPFRLWLEDAIVYAGESPNGDSLPPILDDRLLVKEWEDTISRLEVDIQAHYSLGQGNHNTTNLLSYNCEGYYFSNGLCGCATIAIVETCFAFHWPSYLGWETPANRNRVYFDWEELDKHRSYGKPLGISKEGSYAQCCESDKELCHTQLSKLCRIVGDYGDAFYTDDGTAMYPDNIKKACNYIFGNGNTSQNWKNFEMHHSFAKDNLLIVCGESQYEGKPAHAWVCDGIHQYHIIHYLATRKSIFSNWEIVSQQSAVSTLYHFNWGWYCLGNGWFSNLTPVINAENRSGYKNLKYINIHKP